MKYEASSLLDLARTTWTDVEVLVRQAFRTDSRFGPRKSLSRVAENNGFMSVCCILRPDWIDATDLPTTLLFKFTYSGGVEALDGLTGMNECSRKRIKRAIKMSHNTEGAFYSLVTPQLAEYLSVPYPFIHTSVVHDEDVGILVLQYIESINLPCSQPLAMSEIDQILRVISRVQSFSLKENVATKRELDWNPYDSIGTMVLIPPTVKHVVLDLPNTWGKEFSRFARRLWDVVDDVYDVDVAMQEKKVIASVLVNGDIWQPNLLWNTDGGPRKLKGLVDWQAAHIGSPAEDIAFLLCVTVTGEDRRRHWKSMLTKLHGMVAEEMAPSPVPYTVQEMIASYERLFPFVALTLLCRLSVICRFIADSQSEEEKNFITSNLLCLAEDILSAVEST